jgi:hypothetical protein
MDLGIPAIRRLVGVGVPGRTSDDLVGSTGKFEPFIRETQPDQFMSFH